MPDFTQISAIAHMCAIDGGACAGIDPGRAATASSGALWAIGTQTPGVGDATLGVTTRAALASSRFQVGPPFTFYDPETPPTVVDEKRPGHQPGFFDVAFGVVDEASNVPFPVSPLLRSSSSLVSRA